MIMHASMHVYSRALRYSRTGTDTVTDQHTTPYHLFTVPRVLVKCVTVSKLVSSADRLQPLLRHATDLGLGGEHAVQDAAQRLKHVHSLIELRDRIRRAVELCSPSRMKR